MGLIDYNKFSPNWTMELESPITEEQWDMIADTDFDNTNHIWFHTKNGKEVHFYKNSIPIEYIEEWLKELRKSLRNVQMSIPAYNDAMNKLDEFERVIHMMIYDWRNENESNTNT